MTDNRQHRTFRPRPFEDGHALTFTVREVYDPAGEFQSQHHDREAAAYAFGLARRHASYAELRDTDGRVIATYARGRGTEWYPQGGAQ
jgi:hypothetical protein